MCLHETTLRQLYKKHVVNTHADGFILLNQPDTDSDEKRTTAKGKLRLILLLLALYYSTSELLKDSHFSEANMYAHPPQKQYVVSTLGPRPMV